MNELRSWQLGSSDAMTSSSHSYLFSPWIAGARLRPVFGPDASDKLPKHFLCHTGRSSLQWPIDEEMEGNACRDDHTQYHIQISKALTGLHRKIKG